jgi:glycerol-3-phosphate O-acyltransferase
MSHNCVLEVFIEQRRSRSGKIKAPNEVLFDHIISLYLKNIEASSYGKKDLLLVPITINYDRIHEGESFPLELLGETAQPESCVRILKAFTIIN